MAKPFRRAVLAFFVLAAASLSLVHYLRSPQHSRQLEFCEYNVQKCIEQIVPEGALETVEFRDKDGAVNEKYFRTFHRHLKDYKANFAEAAMALYDAEVRTNAPSGSETPPAGKQNAAVVLVHSGDIARAVATVSSLQKAFNAEYAYPWAFVSLDGRKWTGRDKKRLRKAAGTSVADEQFVVVPEGLGETQLHTLEAFGQFEYLMTVHAGAEFHCDFGYDVVAHMAANNKTYGFVSGHVPHDATPALRQNWDTFVAFLKHGTNADLVGQDAGLDWLTQDLSDPNANRETNGYSGCVFSKGLEIVHTRFLSESAYTQWTEFAHNEDPVAVRTLGVVAFQSRDKLHWFSDIGMDYDRVGSCPDRCKVCRLVDMSVKKCMGTWVQYGEPRGSAVPEPEPEPST